MIILLMHYAFESIMVGLYTLTIFWMLRPYVLDKNLLFFLTGFSKHFLGWFIGLQTYYCKFGNACQRYVSGNNTERKFSFPGQILLESIGEGLIFVLVLTLMFRIFRQNKYLTLFATGFALHMVFEVMGFHHKYCIDGCSRNVH
jgi:hypothetical protein